MQNVKHKMCIPTESLSLRKCNMEEGHEANYKVYVCFVQSIASSEEVRCICFHENSNTLNPVMSRADKFQPELLSELLEKCIRFECEIDEETIVLRRRC